jgi:hypothetical protein
MPDQCKHVIHFGLDAQNQLTVVARLGHTLQYLKTNQHNELGVPEGRKLGSIETFKCLLIIGKGKYSLSFSDFVNT